MGFKMTVELDVDDNPDAIGEALRSRFFVEEEVEMRVGGRTIPGPDGEPETYKKTGCYSSFDWQPDIEPLPDYIGCDKDAFYDHEKEVWTRGELTLPDGNKIECRYYWDGDGTLAFKIPDGRWLVNHDCKKAGGWDLLPEGAEV